MFGIFLFLSSLPSDRRLERGMNVSLCWRRPGRGWIPPSSWTRFYEETPKSFSPSKRAPSTQILLWVFGRNSTVFNGQWEVVSFKKWNLNGCGARFLTQSRDGRGESNWCWECVPATLAAAHWVFWKSQISSMIFSFNPFHTMDRSPIWFRGRMGAKSCGSG